MPRGSLTVLACATLVASTSGAQRIPARDTTAIAVDNSVTFQKIDGFGGTTLPLVYPSGDHLGAYRQDAIRAAFGNVGISLGMLSIGVVEAPANAADPYAQRGNDNGDPFVRNPAGFNFSGSDILRSNILNPARAFGYSGLELGPLISLRGPLDWLKLIRSADYPRYLDELAENVLATMEHWRDAYGLTPRLLHLFNEPTGGGDPELQPGSIQEVVDIVKRVGARLRGAGFADVTFVVPNDENIVRSLEVAQAILADSVARPFVGVIGYHAYPYGSVYSSPRRILETSGSGSPDIATRGQLEGLKALGGRYGVPIWLTEISEGPGNQDYPFDAIENVLARAIHIHDNFEYAGATGYFGMLTIWDSRTLEEHTAGRTMYPLLSDAASIVLADMSTGTMHISGMGHAIAHYANWLKPGAMRIASTSDNARVIVTAFRDTASRSVIVVAVNNNSTAQQLRITISGAVTLGSVKGDLSNEDLRRRVVPPFAPSSAGEVLYRAPPRSVVTLSIPVQPPQ